MCLAIPAQVKSVNQMEAEADMGGISRRISLWLTPDVRPGDYVLVHTGYAISVLSQEDAEETLRVFEEIEEAAEEAA